MYIYCSLYKIHSIRGIPFQHHMGSLGARLLFFTKTATEPSKEKQITLQEPKTAQ